MKGRVQEGNAAAGKEDGIGMDAGTATTNIHTHTHTHTRTSTPLSRRRCCLFGQPFPCSLPFIAPITPHNCGSLPGLNSRRSSPDDPWLCLVALP